MKIELDTGLPDDPRVDRLAAVLGVKRREALGVVVALLARVALHDPLGGAVVGECVNRWCDVSPRVDLLAALIASGWCEAVGSGGQHGPCVVAGWSGGPGRAFARMEANRARHRAARARATRSAVVQASPPPLFDPPSDIDPADELLAKWNALAIELALPTVTVTTKAQRAKARACVGDGLLRRWPEFAAALKASPFYLGGGEGKWRACFSWLVSGKWRNLLDGRRPFDPPFTVGLAS